MAIRFLFLTGLFVLLFGSLSAKLYSVQVRKSDEYIRRAEARLELIAQRELRRGQIFFTDRYNKAIPVALNKDYPIIYTVPQEIEDPVNTAKVLAPKVGWGEAELLKILSNKKSFFRVLIEKAPKEKVKEIEELDVQGISVGKKQYRYYPFANLAAHVLGFAGMNENHSEPIGLYGLEKSENERLSEGDDVSYTLDRNLQARSEEVLRDLVDRFNAQGGSVVIQEPKSGKVLVVANEPSFDPNEYGKFPIERFANPAIEHMYEPGSAFKPITMAAGIDAGVITPLTTYVDKGSVSLNGKTIKNWDLKAHGQVTMTNAIEQSINTATVFAESRIGHAGFKQYVERFGFGEETGIDLPGETAGSIKNLQKKNTQDIDFATAAFGQGTAVTPVQLINAFSALANGGLLMRPYVKSTGKPYVVRRVISEESASAVTNMMESAVEKAKVAAIPSYRIAGKTGTAQIPDFKHGGYAEEFIHTFVGFAPVTDPKFVILIKLDKPSATLAGTTVVPAFQKLAQYVLSYYNIPPDKL